MRTIALAAAALLSIGLTGCGGSGAPAVRDEAAYVELVRAAGGTSAELSTDAELIAEGDEICKIATADGGTIEEFGELTKRMADAATEQVSAAQFVALQAEAAAATLCP